MDRLRTYAFFSLLVLLNFQTLQVDVSIFLFLLFSHFGTFKLIPVVRGCLDTLVRNIVRTEAPGTTLILEEKVAGDAEQGGEIGKTNI